MDNLLWTYTRRAALVVLAALLVGLAALTTPQLAPTASAYMLRDGCSEYDPDRDITYTCVPDRSTFYTPDGIDPTRVIQGTEYSGETRMYDGDGSGSVIPPPAPYVAGRDYCSNPWYGNSSYEHLWQYSCYRHDVCYGSQLGRKYCDVMFWHHMGQDCKAAYAVWEVWDRYPCLFDARLWYWAVRWKGASHYKPRQSSEEPRGE